MEFLYTAITISSFADPCRIPPRRTHFLVRHWSLIHIGAVTHELNYSPWTISTSEYRENLQWAVVVPADTEISPAVTQLLSELAARSITIQGL